MEKILCQKCNEMKTIDNFSVRENRKRGYHTWCKSCVKEYDRERHQKNREKILQQKKDRRLLIREWFDTYKSNLSCEKCGENHIATLDFHHIDSNEKEYIISDMVRYGFSIENIEKEISKCIILCANCHRILHYEENKRAVG